MIAKDGQRSPKFAKDCQRLPKIAKDCQRSPKIAKDPQRSPKIAEDCQGLGAKRLGKTFGILWGYRDLDTQTYKGGTGNLVSNIG